MKRYACLDNKEIGKVFGRLHYSAVSKAAARLERELSKDKDLAKLLDRLVSNVNRLLPKQLPNQVFRSRQGNLF